MNAFISSLKAPIYPQRSQPKISLSYLGFVSEVLHRVNAFVWYFRGVLLKITFWAFPLVSTGKYLAIIVRFPISALSCSVQFSECNTALVCSLRHIL